MHVQPHALHFKIGTITKPPKQQEREKRQQITIIFGYFGTQINAPALR